MRRRLSLINIFADVDWVTFPRGHGTTCCFPSQSHAWGSEPAPATSPQGEMHHCHEVHGEWLWTLELHLEFGFGCVERPELARSETAGCPAGLHVLGPPWGPDRWAPSTCPSPVLRFLWGFVPQPEHLGLLELCISRGSCWLFCVLGSDTSGECVDHCGGVSVPLSNRPPPRCSVLVLVVPCCLHLRQWVNCGSSCSVLHPSSSRDYSRCLVRLSSS